MQGQDPELVIVTSEAPAPEPSEGEQMDTVSAVPINVNWQV